VYENLMMERLLDCIVLGNLLVAYTEVWTAYSSYVLDQLPCLFNQSYSVK